MNPKSFQLKLPDSVRSCAVFSSAHSGQMFPDDFLQRSSLSLPDLRSSEDAFVDQLLCNAPNMGAPLICANFSRAFVDLNRNASELDPAMILGLSKQPPNPRVAAGLGVLPRVVAQGKSISNGKISLGEAQDRLQRYYHPFHSALRDIITEQKQRFGCCHLVDVHSMPSDALSGNSRFAGSQDIVLGDRFGQSCDRWFLDAVEKSLKTAGFKVVRNVPFAGGYITQNYGKPKSNISAVQIEINRALYMDEKHIEPLPEFGKFQQVFSQVIAEIAALGPAAQQFAAE